MIAVIDYQAGNATSVLRALTAVGGRAAITADPAVVAGADAVVFPGVGAAGQAMAAFTQRGLDEGLRRAIARGVPVLCVCIGLQLLFDASAEDGGTRCLGLLRGRVERLPGGPGLKIPHMGWNEVVFADDPLARDLPDRSFYFVHSYAARPAPEVAVIARTDYGGEVCAGVRRDNLVAFQFHVEKSGVAGLALLANFVRSGG